MGKLESSACGESENVASGDDKKEDFTKSTEDEEDKIYAADFLKEDDIKEEIKEEVDSDDLVDDTFDSDEYNYESENEDEEEDEEVENMVSKSEVKEEATVNNSIKEEI